MGTIKQGILGGFSGKVGTAIGSSWKGISYMRGRAQSVKNPRTEGQMEQRSKFALTLDFLLLATLRQLPHFRQHLHHCEGVELAVAEQ